MSSPDPHVRAARNARNAVSDPDDHADIAGQAGRADRTEQADRAEQVAVAHAVPASAPVIAVTGAASGVGALLTERLLGSEQVRRVLALDERRGAAEGAQWHVLDVRDPAIADRLRGDGRPVDVVVHLALDLDLETDPVARTAYNVRGTQTVLTAAAAAGVRRVVLCTSAMVYGALADNDVPLAEDAELRATAEATAVGDLLEIERLARRAPRAHPGLNVTVLRPTVLVGGPDTALTRYFESPRLLVVAGSRPCWQFCHVEDLVSALEYAALERVEGELVVGCDGWLEQEEVEELTGIRRMELPSAVAVGAASRLHRLRLTPSPAGDLAYTMHPWVVSGSRLHEAGWRPAWTNEAALADLLERASGRHTVAGRRLGRKDATTLGAAGATVALVGTAALVRRARKARRRL